MRLAPGRINDGRHPVATGLPLTGSRRSSRCGEFDNACVEVSRRRGGVAVRDSKALSRTPLVVGARAWAVFLDSTREPNP